MGERLKTTVELADYRRLEVLAQAEGRKAADVIREAVSEYAQRRVPSRRPRTIGIAARGLADLAQRDGGLPGRLRPGIVIVADTSARAMSGSCPPQSCPKSITCC
jgi:hypothetical protein